MGRYWAVWLGSIVMRLIGALSLLYSLTAIVTLLMNELGFIQLPTTADDFAEYLTLSYDIINYNFWAYYGIPIAIAWYGGGQLLTLLMDMQRDGEIRTRIMRARFAPVVMMPQSMT